MAQLKEAVSESDKHKRAFGMEAQICSMFWERNKRPEQGRNMFHLRSVVLIRGRSEVHGSGYGRERIDVGM
jgi:hypothetical protein